MKIRPFLFFVLFCFSCHFFETTEICLGSTKMEITGKNHISRSEKIGKKLTLPPLKNIPLTPLGLILS